MSAGERSAPGRPAAREHGTIVVVGGGCYGSYYVRQLLRARAAGALDWRRLAVVDRDPECRVAREYGDGEAEGGPEVIVADWKGFFADYLAAASADRAVSARDAIVPSPLMPHLMYEWLVARARERWPNAIVEGRPLETAPAIPWQRAAPDGTHLVSFAEWMCPINCVEPARCPKTRGERSWSMPPAMRAYVEAERSRGRPLLGPIVFHCEHRAYGVGMFDTRAVVDADDAVGRAFDGSAAELLVATVSHCHGVMNRLLIAPRPA